MFGSPGFVTQSQGANRDARGSFGTRQSGQHPNLTHGVSELKIDVGLGYRIYFSQRANVLIVLLCAGDKRSQSRDIEEAIRLVSLFKDWPMKNLPEGFAPYDSANYLSTEADTSEYSKTCAEDDADPKLLLHALSVIARVRNKAALARDAGLTRSGLYRALAPDGNPSFATVQSIAKGLGLKITFAVAGIA